MSAYIERLEAEADRLAVVGERIALGYLEQYETMSTEGRQAVMEQLSAIRNAVEKYRQQALWERHQKGQILSVRPTEPAWSN